MSDEQQKDKSQIEQLRLKYDFWKFMAGSVAVVLVTTILNFTISCAQLEFDRQQKQQELALKRLQNEQDFIGKFIDQALDDNLEKRTRFAHYFASLTDSSEGQGQRWDEYHATLESTAIIVQTSLARANAEATQVAKSLGEARSTATKAAIVEATALQELAEITTTPGSNSNIERTIAAVAIQQETATVAAEKLQEQEGKSQAIQEERQYLDSELTRVVTPTPIPPPTPTPLPCTYNREPFASSWEKYKERLGCPREARFGPYAWQRFENGDVFWSGSHLLDFFVIAQDDGRWRRAFGEEIPDPDPNCLPEETNLKSDSAMHRLRCSEQGADLGRAELVEQNGAIAFQDFDSGGLIWINERRGENFIFFNDGTFIGPQR